ncbi:MAG: FRG domain-containing protein [Methanomassiliicoccales archaeon]|nr:MAG: FRG domain-containing protein [Methanomassiliicoccales archaeon]
MIYENTNIPVRGGIIIKEEEIIKSAKCLFELLPMDSKVRYYFRGIPRSNYELVPKLLRKNTLTAISKIYQENDPILLQKALLQRFRRYAPTYYTGTQFGTLSDDVDSAGCLCLAQHYGLPTLLLDWTLNPLAALYFAVTKHDREDGCIWSMELKPRNKRMDLTIHLEDYEKLPERPTSPLLVVPRPFTPRIAAQAGRFTCSIDPTPLNSYTKKRPWTEMRQWKILGKSKKRIRKELSMLQVHEGTMFPGLEGYAKYLAGGGL